MNDINFVSLFFSLVQHYSHLKKSKENFVTLLLSYTTHTEFEMPYIQKKSCILYLIKETLHLLSYLAF